MKHAKWFLLFSLLAAAWTISILHAVEKSDTGDAARDPTKSLAAHDFNMMQGRWKVSFVMPPSPGLSNDGPLPEELGFTKYGSEISIQGNTILFNHKIVATFANDLRLPHQQKELGFKPWRLILLTLPSGKGILCSYDVSDESLEIAYSHKCSCNRGSGHLITFKRLPK